ncbi:MULTISPECIES: hypothetical protein [Colwellia]|uniref:Uncharacterized protein n=1 Tax=Colwellia marinimaniae TaxID=1513592 RepID=A0ABQ0MRM1_9GAMM|nr:MULTISPECIES: hypothetical protein [Colwellia]GAW95007.1 hypothetical protein MTCD1_00606 [Colwellia marinimaniae]
MIFLKKLLLGINTFIKSNLLVLVIASVITYVAIYDYMHGAFNNANFLEGIWVEFHGFIIEAVLILIGLAVWNKRQEKKRITPIMHLILKRVDDIELWLRVGFKRAVDKDHTKEENINTIRFALGEIERDFERFVFLMDINAANLTSHITPDLLEIMELIEDLKQKVNFVSIHLTKQDKRCDYILFSPLDDLQKLTDIFNSLVLSFNYKFKEPRPAPSNDEIDNSWEDYANDNALFTPLNYIYKRNHKIHVFDRGTLINGKIECPKGVTVHCFKH